MTVKEDCSCKLDDVKEDKCQCSGITETSFVKSPATNANFTVNPSAKEVKSEVKKEPFKYKHQPKPTSITKFGVKINL